ncbi:hypothetical protein LINGRAHAP2_LOCUS14173 [Linum grandiflorum]
MVGTARKSPKPWAWWESSSPYQHHHSSRTWAPSQAPYQIACQSWSGSQRTSRQHGRCGNQAIGAYLLPICPGWFMMMTWEVKLAASLDGSSLELDATYPRLISFTATFLTLKPTLSPGRASCRASWCISTDLTSIVKPVGPKLTTILGLRTPVSTRPTGTVPMPPILYTS